MRCRLTRPSPHYPPVNLTHVVVGEDFCFGKDRAGNAEGLRAFGAEMGFGVTIAPMLKTEAGNVSSTAIRRALGDGNPRLAAQMLGHWHSIDGPVIKGDQRGRDLGYPTANMSIKGLHPPKFGVYAVRVNVLDGPNMGSYHGAASIGVRPMFGGEEKFDSLDALITQMDADCARARGILRDV